MKVAAVALCACFVGVLFVAQKSRAQEKLNVPPPGFMALFNGKDLTGWKGIPLKANPNPKKKESNPYVPMTMPERLSASPEALAEAQKRGDESAHAHWKVQNGILVFDGKGHNLCTAKDYGDFELLVDWKIEKGGDSGIYLRGCPQVQIWDSAHPEYFKHGAEKGSGSLWNNKKNPRLPDVKADKPLGEWNTFHITMVGEKVTVKLNGQTVVNNVTMENLFEPEKPIYATGPIELQNHGNTLYFRNIFIKELL